MLLECTFEDNDSTSVISARDSNITIAQSTFRHNSDVSNSQLIKGILYFNGYSSAMIVNNIFINNEGDLLHATIHGHDASATVARDLNAVSINRCEFRNNFKYYDGIGAINVQNYEVSITDTKFINNTVITFLSAFQSIINIDKSVFRYNSDPESLIFVQECTMDIFHSVFDSNQALKDQHEYYDGALTSHNSIIHIHGSDFKNNVAKSRGGAVYCTGESLISFSEVCTFTNNYAEQGGAIYLDQGAQCFIAYGANMIIANNTASYDGGGIYFDDHTNLTLSSHSTLQIFENSAAQNGGGIYASEILSISLAFKSLHNNDQTSNSMIYFCKNKARKGGGLYLGLNSTIRIFMCLNNTINFDRNSAEYGGAMYIFNNLSTALYPECFFHSTPNLVPTYHILLWHYRKV